MTAALQPETKSPSRRALLAGALGGIGALAATVIGRADPVRAGVDGDVVLGFNNPSTVTTEISNSTNSNIVFKGTSQTGLAVWGQSGTNSGVFGTSGSSFGVQGFSSSNVGVQGVSDSISQPASVGYSSGNSTGVQGSSGALPPAKVKTGVFGYAIQDATATGVRGESTIGVGVRGKATTGYAGYFDGRVFTTRYYEMVEISTLNAPASNQARLFIRDNGSGKTQLCVRFHTGAARVIIAEL